jgi:sugar phosphate isomerase/epimerase
LFPSGIRLTGNDTDEEKIRSYLDMAFSRIVQLGTKTVVLGSGGARRIPDGFDPIEGRKQFLNTAGVTGDLAAKYSLTIVIEPLNQKETNLINSVKEGIAFVKELNHPNVKLLADFYHMRMEDEPMAVIEEAGTLLHHVHVAKGHTRTYPLSKEEDTYGQLFEALRNIKYDKGISIEGSTDNLAEDGPAALSLLQALHRAL